MNSVTSYYLALVLLLVLSTQPTSAFVVSPSFQANNQQLQQQGSQSIRRSSSSSFFVKTKTLQLDASVEKDLQGDQNLSTQQHAQDVFPSAEFITFELADHRPLGLTIEESLDPDEDYVFVSKIIPDGFAEMAGIQVGDVVVGVTGLFGEMTPVLEAGVDKIKGLVGSVADEDPLSLQIARGTGVLDRHESAVVDLCQVNGASDKEVENCVVDFLKSGYSDAAYNANDDDNNNDDDMEFECDDDAECMLDDMMDMWADELPLPPTTSGISDQPAGGENTGKKPKPWSSRSSPSGTFVRDPVTGEMRNIDA